MSNDQYAYWMSDMYSCLADKPLKRIVYPGSHDAGSYNMKDIYVSGSAGIVAWMIRQRGVEHVRRVQRDPIGVQLNAGCRFFDLRIVRLTSGEYHCEHEFVAEAFENILSEIYQYLKTGEINHKRELIILHFSKFSCIGRPDTKDDINCLSDMIKDRIGSYLYHGQEKNVQDMLYRNFFEGLKPCVLAFGAVNSDIKFDMECANWPNSSNVNNIIENERKCYYNYVRSNQPKACYRMHFTATFQVQDLAVRSQMESVQNLNKHLGDLGDMLMESVDNGYLINIIYVDSPADTNAAELAVCMNQRLTKNLTVNGRKCFFGYKFITYHEKRNASAPCVTYSTMVKGDGWKPEVPEAVSSGTVALNMQLEKIKIRLVDPKDSCHIRYCVYSSGKGWQAKVQDGEAAGSERSYIESVKIELDSSYNYDVMYRVHQHNLGWSDWKMFGEAAGITGKSLWLEAIQIKVIELHTDVIEEG